MKDFDSLRQKATDILSAFPWTKYIFGWNIFGRITELLSNTLNEKIGHLALITNLHLRDKATYDRLFHFLKKIAPTISGPLTAPRPNTPVEDVIQLAATLKSLNPEAVVVVSGGSGIDGAKAAVVLATLGGEVEDYFGQGVVSQVLSHQERSLPPLYAFQTAAGSAAHLTKYANITNWSIRQKKLIIDEAIIPRGAWFDYSLTMTAPLSLTLDGAIDGLSHCLEVYVGGSKNPYFSQIEEISLLGIELILFALPQVIKNPRDEKARYLLGLATDLGGYAIMLGGTNAGHLSSFALVDILSHGRACGLLNPYFLVAFSAAIPRQLTKLAELLRRHQLIAVLPRKSHSSLAYEVAQGLQNFYRQVGFPCNLKEIPGYSASHLERLLAMVTNPQLQSKLQNMPRPLTSEEAQNLFSEVLQAAEKGDLSALRPLEPAEF
ncbi:MAG: iron-containing alcohol dehydrogenase [Candidatus Aminicenantes bacterium]|nr:MAG: iron-containing alcohol dehydrogenase [Candidatus Aminicenantes bacterium]